MPTHIDCFAGPGGICTGMHAAGFDTRVAIEFIESCCDTYRANHPEVHVIHSDIRDVKNEQVLPYIDEAGVDLVTSGMPCETFSTAGNTSRAAYDDRQFLFREGIRIAQMTNAKMILFENVPAITSKMTELGGNQLIVDVLKQELKDAGYGNYIETVLSATDFGVPQNRKRYFILATRFPDWELSIPRPEEFTWEELPISRPVNVSMALDGLPDVVPNSDEEAHEYNGGNTSYFELMQNREFWRREEFTNNLTYQKPMRHRQATLQRFALLNQGESLKNLFDRYQGEERERLQEQRVLPKKMFIKRNHRLELDKPAPTVTSHCLDEFVHPTSNRALTVRECARLQSFPDSYKFVGGPYLTPHLHNNIQDKYEQIGDAVPPLLAYAWGVKIARILEEHRDAI